MLSSTKYIGENCEQRFIDWSSLTYGDRAFPVAPATSWNRLPYNIRDSQSIDTFKSTLKKFLFFIAFEL